MICYDSSVTIAKKTEFDKFAYSAIILNLNDYVITKLGKHDFAKSLWDKLEELYAEASLPNKLFYSKNSFVLNSL